MPKQSKHRAPVGRHGISGPTPASMPCRSLSPFLLPFVGLSFLSQSPERPDLLFLGCCLTHTRSVLFALLFRRWQLARAEGAPRGCTGPEFREIFREIGSLGPLSIAEATLSIAEAKRRKHNSTAAIISIQRGGRINNRLCWSFSGCRTSGFVYA